MCMVSFTIHNLYHLMLFISFIHLMNKQVVLCEMIFLCKMNSPLMLLVIDQLNKTKMLQKENDLL